MRQGVESIISHLSAHLLQIQQTLGNAYKCIIKGFITISIASVEFN